MAPTKDSLTAPDLMVLEALTHSTTTVSAMTLAADLWRDGDTTMGADPVGFVVWVLTALADKGLVTYREHGVRHNPDAMDGEFRGYDPYERLPFQIRLSRDGWALMGYPTFHVQVNSRLSTMQRLDPAGDRTNFRKHDFKAEGGVILTETFQEHRVKFPHHVHPLMYSEDKMPTRRYVKITADLEQGIVKYRDEHPEASVADIGEALAYSERTVRYVLYDLPRIRHNSNEPKSDASTKMRIALALRAMDYPNVADLRKDLGRSEDAHSIVHLLHSLHSEGKVDFSEKAGRNEPINIRLTVRGHDWLLRQEQDQAVADILAAAPQDPDDVESVAFGSVGNPDAPRYPELDALLEREKQRLDSDNRAMRYIEAAELIRETDPETAALLDTKAAESDIPFPSPLEAEYLQYVADHE